MIDINDTAPPMIGKNAEIGVNGTIGKVGTCAESPCISSPYLI